jgi:hypothetical protein
MTVLTTTTYNKYTGDGVENNFVGTFPCLTAADLRVFVDNSEVLPANYTLSGDITAPGWSVGLQSAPALDVPIRLQRLTPPVQETIYTPYGQYKAKQHESDFDYAMFLLQEVRDGLGSLIANIPGLGEVIDVQGRRIINLGDPIDDHDATNKAWVLANGGGGGGGDFNPAADQIITGNWNFTGFLRKSGFDVWHLGNLPQPTNKNVNETITGQWTFNEAVYLGKDLWIWDDIADTFYKVMDMLPVPELGTGEHFAIGIAEGTPRNNLLAGNWYVANYLRAEQGYGVLRPNDSTFLNVALSTPLYGLTIGDLDTQLTFVETQAAPRHYDGTVNDYYMLSTKFYDPRAVEFTTNDAQMISIDFPFAIDNTNFIIHADVPYGIPKLTGGGKIKLDQIAISELEFLGTWDASGGLLPPDTQHGAFYIISTPGTLDLNDRTTGVPTPTPVVVGDYILYADIAQAPDIPASGWYLVHPELGATLPASNVIYNNANSGWDSTDVQSALDEIWNENTSALPIDYQIPNPIETPLIFRAAAGQSAPLQEWFPDAAGGFGSIVAKITPEADLQGRRLIGLNAGGESFELGLSILAKLTIDNSAPNGSFELRQLNAGIAKQFLAAIPNGNTLDLYAYWNQEFRMGWRVDGVNIYQSAATTGNRLNFATQAGVSQFALELLGTQASWGLYGGAGLAAIPFRIQVSNGSTSQIGFQLRADDAASLVHPIDSNPKLSTTAFGVDVRNTINTSAQPIFRMLAGNGAIPLDMTGLLNGIAEINAASSLRLKSNGQLGIQIDNGPTFYSGGIRKVDVSTVALNMYTNDTYASAQFFMSFVNAAGAETYGAIVMSGPNNYLGMIGYKAGMTLSFYTQDSGNIQRFAGFFDADDGWALYRNANQLAFQTLNTAAQANSFVKIADSTNTMRPAGFNVMFRTDIGASRALTLADAGGLMLLTASVTITIPASVFGFGEIITLINNQANNCVIAPGSGVSLTYLAGGSNLSGARTIAGNSVVTLWFPNSTSAYIWGNGIT